MSYWNAKAVEINLDAQKAAELGDQPKRHQQFSEDMLYENRLKEEMIQSEKDEALFSVVQSRA